MFIGYIYKITGACGKVYIGSTTNYKKRISSHKSSSNTTSSKFLEKPLVFEIKKQDEYINRDYMRSLEQFYIDNAINCVNTNRAYYELPYMKEECIYCKKCVCKINMESHYQTIGCRWARGERGQPNFDCSDFWSEESSSVSSQDRAKTSISH